MPILILTALHYDQTGSGMIIYDSQQDVIVSDLGFCAWLIDRGKYGDDKRYVSTVAETEWVGTTVNVAYKAKIFLNPDDVEAVRQYFSHGNNGRDKLINYIESCVENAIRVQYQVQGYPDMTIRFFSLANTEFYCPLAKEFGYQWAGDLEIMQCYELPNREMERSNCRERLHNSNY
ncbi:MAG: hypothetical protein GF365_03810 [Candidatus Buchananbacteria bacterium]|nr:hypothetical protein [Candidatus Buchananbacteria bacterium]